MATPILKTKLYIPPVRPEMVSRPRLVEWLNAGLDRKLTLISAPAGFGKTSLLSEWVARCELRKRAAWVSLDEGDNDPTRFWSYSVAALQTIVADIGEAALAMLRSPQPPALEPVLTTLINEITAIPEHFVLVLDDYHVIQAQAIHDALAFLLDHLPPHMHLVIAARADPPLPVARLRGRGQVTELREADLRFTAGEVAAFLKQVAGLDLAADDVAALTARTEGWIAGLQMAAASMRGREDVPGFIAAFTGSHEYIADYLSDEVLSQQPKSVRTFLLQTSILERMTGPLCDAVTGQGGGRQALEGLKEANLFIVSLDDERRWYRYHHLFASLLRQRLQQTQPDSVPELHGRASVWYEQNGFVVEAIGHALSGSDFDRVEQLVAERALTMMYHGELATLMGWLEALPHQVVRSRPWLCVAYAWVLGFAGRPGSVEPRLHDAERALEGFDDHVERQRIAGHIAALRAYLSTQDREFSRAVALAREALERVPEDDRMVRSLATAVAGNVLRMSGDLAAAARATTEAIALAEAADAHSLAIDARCDLVKLQMAQGQLRKAAATCHDALRLAGGPTGRGRWPLPIIGQVSAWLSLILGEWNDLEAALHYARDGLEVCRRWGQAGYLGLAYYALAKTLQAMGDTRGALDAIQQAVQAAADLPASIIALVTAWEMQIRLAQGDTAAAWRWAQASGLSVDDGLEFHRYEEYRTLAQALIAQGEPGDAVDWLARLLEMAEATGAMGYAIEVLVLQAIALQANDQADQALATLKRALALAEPEGYVRTFIDEGAPMGQLLQQAIARGMAADYVSKLLAALEGETKDEPFALPVPRQVEGSVAKGPALSGIEGLVEPLSERELQVLRLLTTHLSRREIADELYISANTARFHIKNIYSKLGVHSRSDAIHRAGKLKLL